MRSCLNKTQESFSSNLINRFYQIWWIVRNLMKCDYLNRLIKNTYVAWQVENEHTSLVNSRLDSQNIDDKMIKQDHENKSSQTIFAWKNLYRISQITSHTIENDSCTKKLVSYFSNHISHRDKTQNTLSNIFSQQIVSSIFIAIMSLFIRSWMQKKIVASEKAYNRHVLEKK